MGENGLRRGAIGREVVSLDLREREVRCRSSNSDHNRAWRWGDVESAASSSRMFANIVADKKRRAREGRENS